MKENQWVSVKDRLPETFEDVLVFNSNEETVITIGFFHELKWHIYEIHDFSELVTHWMPLPKPPK